MKKNIYLVEQRNALKVTKSGVITWSDWSVVSAHSAVDSASLECERLNKRAETLVGLLVYRVRFIILH